MPEPEPENAPLEIRLFGPTEVRVGGELLPRLRSRKGYWLLALLALRAGREVERSWIAGTLWPENEEGAALYSLRRSLADLRAALGDEAARITSPSPHSLLLDLSGAWCDVLLFDQAIRRDDSASLDAAVSVYRGPLLEGCNEEWILPERASREEAHLTTLETLASRAIEAGEPAAAARWLRVALAADPFRETAARSRMRALAALGDFSAATAVYQELRRALRRELDSEPAADTTALFEQIQLAARQESAEADYSFDRPARPEGQGVWEFRPAPLPRPITPLVGRDAEVRRVRECLQTSRLVTLLGPGGIGKTRLSIQVAEESREAYAEGAWFVDLAGVTDPALLPRAVARALGIREKGAAGRQAAEMGMAALVGCLAPRKLLVVLDNCEHLAATCAQLAGALLENCPEVALLATSRQPLGIVGEVLWRVPGLAAADASPPPDSFLDSEVEAAALQSPAVRLFTERARAGSPDFRLTAANLGHVTAICRRLDGIPLALELAAARVRVLSPQQIEARLDDRFHLLTGGSTAARPRHQTLRAAVDWSYDLLGEEERALFRRLAVFPAGCTLDGAERMGEWGNGGALEVLAQLCDKSLIVNRPGASGVARYSMLETLREYSRERLEETGERDRAAAGLIAWAVDLVDRARAARRTNEWTAWLERLEDEHENLRAALEAALDRSSPAPEAALRLGAGLWRYWDVRGRWSEGYELLSRALAGGDSDADASGDLGEALCGAGNLARRRGDYPVAGAHYQRGLALARRSGNSSGLRALLHEAGYLGVLQGDYGEARALYEESLALAAEAGDAADRAALLNDLGEVARLEGDPRRAAALYEECVDLARRSRDRGTAAGALANLGNLAAARGDYATARRYGNESLFLLRQLGDRWGTSLVLNNLSLAALCLGELGEAEALCREGLALRRELDDRWGLPMSLEAMAGVRAAQQRGEESARLLGAAEALRERVAAAPDPADEAERGRTEETARALCGPEGFEGARREGRWLTAEEAVALALGDG